LTQQSDLVKLHEQRKGLLAFSNSSLDVLLGNGQTSTDQPFYFFGKIQLDYVLQRIGTLGPEFLASLVESLAWLDV
jgi:hypothetical protein